MADAPASLGLPRATVGGSRLPLPSLHFIASSDEHVPPAQQEELAGAFDNPAIHRHDKGHTIPQRAGDVAAMVSFFANFQR